MEAVWRFKEDQMTSQERHEALLAGERVDRVGLYLFARGFCAKNVGMSLSEFYSNPEKSLEAQLWTAHMYGQDESLKYGIATFGAWEFGGEMRMPTGEYDQVPVVLKAPVESDEDAKNLKLPDIAESGMTPLIVEFCKLQEKAGLIRTSLVGDPFTLACNVCGMERVAKWMFKNPDLLHEVLRLMTLYCLKLAEYFLETFGVENIEFRTSTPTSSNQVISPKQFQEFSFPYLKEVHEKIVEMGVRYIYTHICGDQSSNLPYYAKIPYGDPGIASFGHEVDLSTAIEFLGEKCIIVGNVNPSVIQSGSPAEVYELSRQCIEKGKASPRGFFLGCGCELPPLAPGCNVWAMRKAVNDFGWYE
jgi:uroporphyrinogen decarboxylase